MTRAATEPRRLEPLTPPLAHPVARVLLAAYLALHALLAIASTGGEWLPLVALLLISGAASAVVLPAELRAGRRATAVAAVLLAAAVVILPLSPAGWPGYQAWPLGAATFIAIALALRGSIGTAWILLGGLAVECVTWSLLHGAGPLPGVDLIVRHAGTLLIGTLFAVGLQRAARSLQVYRQAERARQVERAVSASLGQEQRRAAQRFLDLSAHALQQLTSAQQNGVDRGALLALEGRLRDEIMAPDLLDDEVNDAAAAARARGVDVVLLQGELPEDIASAARHAVTARLAEWLRDASPDSLVLRVVTEGAHLRASAHGDGRGETVTIAGSQPS